MATRTLPDAATSPVVLALDTPDLDVARRWASQTRDSVGLVKVGLELWCAQGPPAVGSLRADGHRVMLDLKLHDIPTTVAHAVAAVAPLGAELLTVHATGGARMLTAAVAAAAGRLDIAAVTVLTSLDAAEAGRLGGVGAVADLAAAAVAAGCGAVVCSPLEAAAVRAAVGPAPRIICPGVRPRDPAAAPGAARRRGDDQARAGDQAPADDQRRVATPRAAIAAGADLIVVGRPITAAPDLGQASSAVAEDAARAHLPS